MVQERFGSINFDGMSSKWRSKDSDAHARQTEEKKHIKLYCKYFNDKYVMMTQ